MNVSELKNIFVESVENTINIESCLQTAERIGRLLVNNDIDLYSLPQIEHICIDRVRGCVNCDTPVNLKEILFVIGRPLLKGGHTRLMERLSEAVTAPDLLITQLAPDKTIEKLAGYFDNIISLNPNSYQESLQLILNNIVQYKKIVIFIDPEDITFFIALKLARENNKHLQSYFVNHADHSFTYGVTVADFWLGISSYGEFIDTKREGLTAQKSFIGIPVDIPSNFNAAKYINADEINTIITAAGGHKYKPEHGQDIKPLIQYLLKKLPNAQISIIGLKNYSHAGRWLVLKLFHLKRLFFIRALPYDEYKKLTSEAEVFLDSHPMPGGTAFVEQYFLGKYCIGLKSKWYGYTPLEVVKSDSINEIFTNRLITNKTNESDLLSAVIETHAIENVNKRFFGVLYNGKIFDNTNTEYSDSAICDNTLPANKFTYFSKSSLELISQNWMLFKYIFKNSLKYKFLFSWVIVFLRK